MCRASMHVYNFLDERSNNNINLLSLYLPPELLLYYIYLPALYFYLIYFIYCCTNPIVLFMLVCLHNCYTHTLACLCTSPPASFYHSLGCFLTTPDLYVQIPEQTMKDFPRLPEHWNGPRSKSSAWRIRLPISAAETPGCCSWSAFPAAFPGVLVQLFVELPGVSLSCTFVFLCSFILRPC